MAKGLFLIFPAHGHINPTIGLVKELISKGDEITYISSEKFRSKIENVGAKFNGFKESYSANMINRNQLGTMTENFLDSYTTLLETALRENDEFDYLVVDPFIRPGKRILEKLKIKKVITNSTTFAINKHVFSSVSESIKKDIEFSKKVEVDFKRMKPRYEKLSEKFQIEFPKNLAEIIVGFKADLTLVYTSKYYQPFSEDFSDSFKFVGPSIFDRKELTDFKIENPDNKKIIFISLGTIGNNNLKFYKECFKALGSRDDLEVLMSIGNKIKVEELGEAPKNFKIYNYVPQLEVLKQTDIFITHGGMNSSSEGLYNGIPLIVVPQFGDQPIVARRVEELGAGIALFKNINKKSISESVNKILANSSYKENARKISKSLKECGGYKKAAEYIHNSLNN